MRKTFRQTTCLFLAIVIFAACKKVPVSPFDYPEAVIKNYEIGIAPSHLTVSPDSLFTQPLAWKEVYEAVDFYKYYGQQVTPDTFVWRTRINPAFFVDFSTSQKIKISCELGSFHLGGRSAELLTDLQLQPILEAGGTITALHLDGPVRRLIKGINKHLQAMSLQQVAERMVEFWQNIHRKYPGIEIGLIANLPNWDYTRQLPGYSGRFSDSTGYTYRQVLDTLYNTLTNAGEKIAFIEVDCPYNYYRKKRTLRNDGVVNNGQKLRALQVWCQQRNIQLHVIINSEASDNSPKTYHDNTLKYLLALRRDRIFPDKFLFQSWYDIPAENLPESGKYTFMNTVRDGIILLRALYPAPNSR